VEALEDRVVPTLNPFSSPVFQQEIQSLIVANDLPQISFAAEQSGQTATYGYSNPFFSYGTANTPVTSADSLFRLASVSKVFAAAAIMNLVQDGKLQLDDDAFQVLGYFNANGTANPLSGYNPLDGSTPVTVMPAAELDGITIQDLLNMSSGLPLSVPVSSISFPSAGKGSPLYVDGSYAALTFAGAFQPSQVPYTGAPASDAQQINYYVYAFTHYGVNLVNPGKYNYNDVGYAVLGDIVNTVALQDYGLDSTCKRISWAPWASRRPWPTRRPEHPWRASDRPWQPTPIRPR